MTMMMMTKGESKQGLVFFESLIRCEIPRFLFSFSPRRDRLSLCFLQLKTHQEKKQSSLFFFVQHIRVITKATALVSVSPLLFTPRVLLATFLAERIRTPRPSFHPTSLSSFLRVVGHISRTTTTTTTTTTKNGFVFIGRHV